MASVRKRKWVAANGEERFSWAADYLDCDGRRRLKSFATRKEATSWLSRTSIEVADGVHTPASRSITVRQACEEWLNDPDQLNLRRETQRHNRNLIVHHVLPLLGNRKLAELRSGTIFEFRDRLLRGETPDGKPRSRDMVRRVLAVLRRVLGEAKKRGKVGSNAATDVVVKRAIEDEDPAGTRRIPGRVEVQAMIDHAPDLRARALIIVGAYCGLRCGEMRGLRWEDVDLEGSTLAVVQAANRWSELGKTKTKSGRRTVPLIPLARNALRELFMASAHKGGLVFCTGSGKVMAHQNIALKIVGAAQRHAGLVTADGRPLYNVHALRHFCASCWIENKISITTIAAMLGHKHPGVTLSVYGHALQDETVAAATIAAMQRGVCLV